MGKTNDINSDFENSEEKNNTKQYPINLNMREHKYSIFDICNQIDSKMIELNPNFQRKKVWKDDRKSELIESILMGIPIPPIYVYQRDDGVLDVLDGKQRISCVYDFCNEKGFRLVKLKHLSSLNGATFNDLQEKDKAQIKRYQFIFYVILPNTDERIKYDIFDRVNRGGVTLNAQEMRNALYCGKATELVDEMSKIKNFKKAAAISDEMTNRMKDHYLILRFIAFYLFINNYVNKTKTINGIDNFLTNIMKEINKNKIHFDFGRLKANFEKAMDFIAQNYNDELFRFSPKGNSKNRRKVNIPLFESLTFAFVTALEQKLDFPSKESINSFKKRLDKPEHITFGIDSNENVQFRFDLAKKLIKEDLNARM